MMPEMNGIELIKKVRNIKKSLAIIGMSASEEERGFLAAGANLFIAKPFSPYALKNIIEEICLYLEKFLMDSIILAGVVTAVPTSPTTMPAA